MMHGYRQGPGAVACAPVGGGRTRSNSRASRTCWAFRSRSSLRGSTARTRRSCRWRISSRFSRASRIPPRAGPVWPSSGRWRVPERPGGAAAAGRHAARPVPGVDVRGRPGEPAGCDKDPVWRVRTEPWRPSGLAPTPHQRAEALWKPGSTGRVRRDAPLSEHLAQDEEQSGREGDGAGMVMIQASAMFAPSTSAAPSRWPPSCRRRPTTGCGWSRPAGRKFGHPIVPAATISAETPCA